MSETEAVTMDFVWLTGASDGGRALFRAKHIESIYPREGGGSQIVMESGSTADCRESPAQIAELIRAAQGTGISVSPSLAGKNPDTALRPPTGFQLSAAEAAPSPPPKPEQPPAGAGDGAEALKAAREAAKSEVYRCITSSKGDFVYKAMAAVDAACDAFHAVQAKALRERCEDNGDGYYIEIKVGENGSIDIRCSEGAMIVIPLANNMVRVTSDHQRDVNIAVEAHRLADTIKANRAFRKKYPGTDPEKRP